MISCPEEIRTKNRRKKNKKKYRDPSWKAKRLAFIKARGGKCEWCGATEFLQVHHPYRNTYGDEVYEDFELSECILLCRRCHTATEHNKTICEREHDDGEVHYRYHDAQMCGECYLKAHPEIVEKREAYRRNQKKWQREARKKEAERVKEWKKEHPQKKPAKNRDSIR